MAPFYHGDAVPPLQCNTALDTMLRSMNAIITVKRFSVLLDPAPGVRVGLDREGRLHEAVVEGDHLRATLDGGMVRRRVRSCRRLRPSAAERTHERLRRLVADTYRRFLRDEATVQYRVEDSLGEQAALERTLDRAVRRDRATRQVEALEFTRLYPTPPRLPPDQLLSVPVRPVRVGVLTACGRAAAWPAEPPDPMSGHLDDLRRFLGRRLDLRRSIFIDDEDWAARESEESLSLLERVQRALGPRPVHAWANPCGEDAISPHFARELWRRGLRRLYLRVESGSRAFRLVRGLPGGVGRLDARIAALKTGGLGVGLTLWVGVGGRPYQKSHLAETMAVLQSLPLDARDRICFSFLRPEAIGRAMREHGLEALDADGARSQFRLLRDRCHRVLGNGVGPRVCLFESSAAGA
jgi:hypothetical protein